MVLLGALNTQAQVTLLRYDSILVKKNATEYFRNPWGGGLNSPQFSPIDLNGDGIKDLFVYERDVAEKNGSVLTFLNGGNADSIDYTYAPEYQSKFPGILNWVLLADYNCDGREDIFTWMPGGIKVYRNDYDTVSGLSFTLASETNAPWSPALTTTGFTGPSNLYVSQFDLPAISDIDDDGDLDILCFCLACESVEFNRNYSMENYGTCDSLEYVIENKCWGEFAEDVFNNTINLGVTCKTGKTGGNTGELKHPGGSSMLALDMDGDQDKELVISNIASNQMNLLINGGDINNASMVTVTSNFPSNSSKVDISVFPAAYYLDVDNDGLKDLIAAPNTTGSVRNFNSAWYYQNQGLANAPIFTFMQNDFMQGEMIEVGEGAYPVFFDHNADGLLDLVLGNFGYWNNSGTFSGELSLYQNIGTTAMPEFELITRDYHGFSSLGLNGLYPTFGDLDGDGDSDMILGEYDGKLHYFDNTSGAGNTAAFTLTEANYKGIDVGQFATPQLVDVNRDGDLDLIIGERGGKIEYYENIGTPLSPNFDSIPTNDFFGGVDMMPSCCTGYNVPFLTPIDTSGEYYLFTAGEDGWIHLYGDIESDLAGTFGLADSMVGNVDLGLRTSISGADINGDGVLDLVIGNYRGGVEIFTLEGSAIIGISALNKPYSPLSLYPNPSNGTVIVNSEDGTPISWLVVKDMLGRTVLFKEGVVQGSIVLDLTHLPGGIYVVESVHEMKYRSGKLVLH